MSTESIVRKRALSQNRLTRGSVQYAVLVMSRIALLVVAAYRLGRRHSLQHGSDSTSGPCTAWRVFKKLLHTACEKRPGLRTRKLVKPMSMWIGPTPVIFVDDDDDDDDDYIKDLRTPYRSLQGLRLTRRPWLRLSAPKALVGYRDGRCRASPLACHVPWQINNVSQCDGFCKAHT